MSTLGLPAIPELLMLKKKSSPGKKKSPSVVTVHFSESPEPGDLPATRKMLEETRLALQSEIRAVKTELRQEIASVRTELKQEIASLRTELGQRIDALTVSQEHLSGQIHEMRILLEEQNANNKIVLEGLTGLFSRQDRVEKRVDAMESTLKNLSVAASAR